MKILESADTAQLRTTIAAVGTRLDKGVTGIRALQEKLAADAEERRGKADEETRKLITETDAARGTVDDAARQEAKELIAREFSSQKKFGELSEERTLEAIRRATIPAWLAAALVLGLVVTQFLGCPS